MNVEKKLTELLMAIDTESYDIWHSLEFSKFLNKNPHAANIFLQKANRDRLKKSYHVNYVIEALPEIADNFLRMNESVTCINIHLKRHWKH